MRFSFNPKQLSHTWNVIPTQVNILLYKIIFLNPERGYSHNYTQGMHTVLFSSKRVEFFPVHLVSPMQSQMHRLLLTALLLNYVLRRVDRGWKAARRRRSTGYDACWVNRDPRLVFLGGLRLPIISWMLDLRVQTYERTRGIVAGVATRCCSATVNSLERLNMSSQEPLGTPVIYDWKVTLGHEWCGTVLELMRMGPDYGNSGSL